MERPEGSADPDFPTKGRKKGGHRKVAPRLFLFLRYILWPHSGLEKYLSEILCNRGKIVGVSRQSVIVSREHQTIVYKHEQDSYL